MMFDTMSSLVADPFDLAQWADGPPHDLFRRMRAEAPVHRTPLTDGTHCWSVVSHAEIAAISRDTATFSSEQGGVFLRADQVVPLEVATNMLLYMDPPRHTHYRLILQKVFTPHAVAKLEDGIRARVTRAIDAFIEDGACDLVPALTVPVPLGVLTELMGVPDVDVPQFFDWTERIVAAQGAPEPAAAAPVLAEMAPYLHAQIERQMADGNAESIVMRLRTGEVKGEELNELEILTFFAVLTFAGNDTTRNTASNGLLALLQHPGLLDELAADPSLIPGAVEESLRWSTVVQWFNRTVTTDTELGGQPIPAGDRVVMWYASGSRDETVFDAPDTFDIRRHKPDHQAFGGGGRHFCLGAGLARAELRIVLEEVTRRMKNLELAGDVERLPSNWANGLTRLPVTFTPGPREAS